MKEDKSKVEDEHDALDSNDKSSIDDYAPWFYKYMDLDVTRNCCLVVALRIIQALFCTANMEHPDEYWQVTQVAYHIVYGGVDLPWEFHTDYRLRNTIYPLIQAIPLYALKTTGLDTNTAVRLCPYLVHSILVVIGDYYLWKLGKSVVGKKATQVAFVFYLTNKT